jgi:hypothetical protein
MVNRLVTRNLVASRLPPQATKEETTMPKVSMVSASQGGDHGPVVEQSADLGDYTVKSPLEACKGRQADVPVRRPRRGLRGRRRVLRAARSHSGRAEPVSEYVQHRRADELRESSEVIMQNVARTDSG